MSPLTTAQGPSNWLIRMRRRETRKSKKKKIPGKQEAKPSRKRSIFSFCDDRSGGTISLSGSLGGSDCNSSSAHSRCEIQNAEIVSLSIIAEEFRLGRDDCESSDSSSEYYEIIDDDDEEESDNETKSHMSQANHRGEDINPVALPSARELSKEICKIVLGSDSGGNSSHSCNENRKLALTALSTIAKWMDASDPTFLKHFFTYGGVAKVLDFLQEILDEEEDDDIPGHKNIVSEGSYDFSTVECIHAAASVISGACCLGGEGLSNNSSNAVAHAAIRNLAIATSSVIVDHNGIETLLFASDMCRQVRDGGDSVSGSEASLEALEAVWTALAKICSAASDGTAEAIATEALALSFWDFGLEAMEGSRFDSGSITPKISTTLVLLRASIFRTFRGVLERKFCDPLVISKDLVERKILTRSLNIFAHGNWRDEIVAVGDDLQYQRSSNQNFTRDSVGESIGAEKEEEFLEEALLFFHGCYTQSLLSFQNTISNKIDNDSFHPTDNENQTVRSLYEGLVPLCTTGLRKCAVKNPSIRKTAVELLHALLDAGNSHHRTLRTELEGAAIFEALAPCLTSKQVDEMEKEMIRELVRTILAPR